MEKKRTAQRDRLQKRKELVKRIVGTDIIETDVDGSYTGMSDDGSAPVQDADDL